MRTYLAFLLAIMLSLNAAYAAAVGVCDALEHNATHFWHHNHEHSDDHVHNEPAADADGARNLPATSDHHHPHVHEVFSCFLPGVIGVTPIEGCSLLIANTVSIFVSAPQALIEHPPRVALA